MPNIIATAEAENIGELYTTKLLVKQHSLVADEPPAFGGQDLGPAPGDYLCMALASCLVITLRMYVNRKAWPMPRINVRVNLVKDNNATAANNIFYCHISPCETLNEEQQEKLLKIAKACPLHRLLNKPSDIVTLFE